MYDFRNFFSSRKTKPVEAFNNTEVSDRFSFFERNLDTRELIQPCLSRFEKEDLWTYLDNTTRRKDKSTGVDIASRMYDQHIPKYMAYDLYNKFYARKDDIVISKPNKENQWLYDFLLDKVNTYYTKPITEQHTMNSAIYTHEIIYSLLKLDQEKNPRGNTGGKGSSLEHTLTGGGGTFAKDIQQALDEAGKNAQAKIQQIDDISKELGDDLDNDDKSQPPGGTNAGSGSNMSISKLDNLEKMYEYLKHVNFNNRQLSNFIKDSLKFSTTYFSTIYKDEEESLLDADDIDTLEGLEHLLPQLRKFGLDDIITYKRKYNMKFDVYVDISGSMGSMQQPNSHLMKAKLVALKLHKLGLVSDFYCFDDRVSSKMKGIKFLSVNSGGGTSIEKVVQQIENLNRPSVIVTDASDSVYTHTNKAYFIGVPGAGFGYDDCETGWDLYLQNHQCVLMKNDGTLAIAHKKSKNVVS